MNEEVNKPKRKRKRYGNGMDLYYKRKAAHLCVDCGAPLPEDVTITLCDFCHKKDVYRQQERTQKRIERHECRHCGTPLPEEYKGTWCEACKAKRREYERRKRERRREAITSQS